MEKTTRPRRRSNVRTETLPDGSAVLFDPQNEMAYPVTVSAAQVWEFCDGEHTVSSLIDRLTAVYDAPEEAIAADVSALLQDLEQKGLLEPTTGVGG